MYRINGEIEVAITTMLVIDTLQVVGGALMAEKSVVMPAWVNWKLGDAHGMYLEALKIDSSNRFSCLSAFKEFCSKYDMTELKRFVSAASSNDFEREGLDARKVL